MQKVKDFKYERADIKALTALYEKATEDVKNAKSAEEIVSVRNSVVSAALKSNTMVALAAIRHTLDVNDKFYAAEQDYYDENCPAVNAKSAEFERAIVNSPFVGQLEKLINPILIRNMRASVRVMDERIVDDSVEENKLVTEYDKLIAGLSFQWEGKSVTISEMMGHTKNKDREIRKRAFEVVGKTLATVSDDLDAIFDKLVKVRDRMAKKLGFENFVEMGDLRIGHIGYGRKEIAVFRDAVLNDVVPVLSELKSELSERMGWDRVHIYDNDVYVNGGNIDPKGSSADLFAAAANIYDDMNERLGSFFKAMVEAEAFDTAPREGKLSGGYAEMLFDFGQPFIFANFNGTMDDVGVLTHEFGHAFAFKCAVDNHIDPDLFVGGMETAETHSMSMEALCNRYNDRFYGDRAVEATYQQIFDAFNFLPYGVTVDYFQELVYTNPNMTPRERKDLWLSLEKKFRPYVDMSGVPYYEIGGRWQYQKHIYEVPFYYIDYCLSTCLALQFGELATTDFDEALKRYLALVDKGGSQNIDDLAHGAGFFSPFDRGALSELSKKIEKHIRSLV